MSLLNNQQNPYETSFVVTFNGGQQTAVQYFMSDPTLNLMNYEPLYGAVLKTPEVHITPPPSLFLASIEARPGDWLTRLPVGPPLKPRDDSFYWQYPAHGPVVWPGVVQCDNPGGGGAGTETPEPSYFFILLVLLVAISAWKIIEKELKERRRQ